MRIAVLALLSEEPMHGYQLMSEISERSGGAWQPSPGSVYPLLQQLTDEGLVKPSEDGDRKIFTLTDTGRNAAEEAHQADFWETRSGDPARTDLRYAIAQFVNAATQVAKTGTPAQTQRAEEIVTNARKELYRILGED